MHPCSPITCELYSAQNSDVLRFAVACVLAVAVSAFDSYATRHGSIAGGTAAALLFLGYSAYCVQNFIRCREIHCAVTGPGFFIAALMEILRLFGVAINPSWPWVVFTVSYAVGMTVEYAFAAFIPR
jgi:hypothetical protein